MVFVHYTVFIQNINAYLALLTWQLIFRKIGNWIRGCVLLFLHYFWRLLFMGSLFNNRSTQSCCNGCYCSTLIWSMKILHVSEYILNLCRKYYITNIYNMIKFLILIIRQISILFLWFPLLLLKQRSKNWISKHGYIHQVILRNTCHIIFSIDLIR